MELMRDITVIVTEDEITSTLVSSDEGVNLLKLNELFTNTSNEFTKITSLNLTNCNLIELPQVVQNWNLKELNLSHNKFTEIPSVLYSNFDALKLLDLSHNFIKSFEIEPACCSVIRVLKLQNNQIINFPQWILVVRCPNLVDIDYSYNAVTSLKASHELKIKRLEMCNVGLIDCDLSFFKKIKTLEYLDVGNCESNTKNNKFQDIDDLFVKPKWENLQVLKMNNLTISILSPGIFWVKNLVELHLINCSLSWLPNDIKYLTNLEILEITNNSICSLPIELTGLEKLKIVKAAQNQIASISSFASKLEILDLFDNHLEVFPDNVENFFLIDLEQNFFDTKNYEFFKEYEDRRDALRKILVADRELGPRDLITSSPMRVSFESSFKESDDSVVYDNSELEANWDDDYAPKQLYERNPQVTSSDEEWCGKEEIVNNKKQLKSKVYVDDDWMFCDAD